MRILLFADIHVGSIKDTRYMEYTMKKIIDKELTHNMTNIVVILGDFFHRLFKVNEEYVTCAINIMDHLVHSCEKNHTILRIVYGTESHEMGQYKLFKDFMDDENRYPNINMKVITTACEERLQIPDKYTRQTETTPVDILYLPEEYVMSKEKFYKPYLYGKKKYQYCFGHGIIREGMPPQALWKAPNPKEKHVPVFDSAELGRVAGLTVFGHVHKYTPMPNNTYYLGSVFRSSFGDEGIKGYGVIEGNNFYMMENEDAYAYETVTIDSNNNAFTSYASLKARVNYVRTKYKDILEGTKAGKVRMVFQAPPNLDPSFRDTLNSLIANEPNLVVVVKENRDRLIEEVRSEIQEKWEYLLDPSLNILDKLYRYITEEKETDMTIDELKKYIEGYDR